MSQTIGQHPLWNKITTNLARVYSAHEAEALVGELQRIIADTKPDLPPVSQRPQPLTSADIALITYANSIRSKDRLQSPLACLDDFLRQHQIDQTINTVHLLPFYPWDTDRGFSVVDFYRVAEENGSWADIQALNRHVNLMFDFVANHASVANPLVQGALIARHLAPQDPRYREHARYQDFVIAYSEEDRPTEHQLQALTRPRPNPVLTPYTVIETNEGALRAFLGEPETIPAAADGTLLGQGYVWTTFSRPRNPDGSEQTRQVDLNFANPQVLLESIRILLFYVKQGADLIRLDAIGYIWKKLGSTSLHEPEAHLILEITKDILQIAAPGVRTIAEVNESQDKVFPYLGEPNHAESDLVYQFTHFPLAVHALLTEDNTYYIRWLESLQAPLPGIIDHNGRQFTTVLGSHDGMGLKPVRGILPEAEIDKLTGILVEQHQALPNYARLAGGAQIVYELCATPWHLINSPRSQLPLAQQIDRYLAVLGLGLLTRGLPALYINGIFGAPNYRPQEGLDENRTINRQIFDRATLDRHLRNRANPMSQVFLNVQRLLRIRADEPAFDPQGQPVVPLDVGNTAVIATHLRAAGNELWTLTNLSRQGQPVSLAMERSTGRLDDLLGGQTVLSDKQNQISLRLAPYQTLWLKPALSR